MTQDELIPVMIDLMAPFNNEDAVITEDTLIDQVISPDDGFPGAGSAPIFKSLVEWTLNANGNEVKDWPTDWLSQSVKQLASVLVMLLFMITCFAQKPLSVSIGAVKTEGNNSAVAFNVSYLPALSFTGKEKLKFGTHSVFSVSPDVQISSGTADAFSSIVAKITGLDVIFKTKTVGKIISPDVSHVIHSIPFSIGVETSNRFNFINSLVEVGYVPWYQAAVKTDWIRHSKIGVFLQAGYKWHLDSAGTLPTGGQVDKSQEKVERGIFRVKGSVGIDTKAILTLSNFRAGLVGNGDIWLDIMNHATYYRLQGAVRIFLGTEDYVDLTFSRGSGAPLFNTGDQFGTTLTVMF